MVCLWSACDEFATPAELSRTQVLGIRAEPPSVSPGASSELEILVADENGRVTSAEIAWEVTALVPEVPPLGQVMGLSGSKAVYTAPPEIPQNPSVATVLATVSPTVSTGESGQPLSALKAIVIGSLPLANPTLTQFTIDSPTGSTDVLISPAITLPPGQAVELDVETEPAITDMSTFAWYSTAGEIERYQSNPTELITNDAPGTGWLFAVVRDGRGGLVWHAVQVTIE